MTFEDVMNLYHRSVSEVFYLIEKQGLPVEPRLPGEEFRFSREKLNKWHLYLPFNLGEMFSGANGRRLTWDEVLDEYAISKEELHDVIRFKSIPYTHSLPCTFLFDRKDIEELLKKNNMSKRNNSKQEITENEVHAMAEEWQNSKDDERVLVLFSLSEFGRLRFYVRGPHLQFLSLLDKEIAPRLNSLANAPLIDYPNAPSNQAEETKERAPRPSWWKRALDWFFPFNIKK